MKEITDVIVKNLNDYNAEELESIYKKIYKEKKDRIDRYKSDIDKKRSIIGEHIIMELLEKRNIDYNKLEFYTNENGKIYIKNRKDIYFNISHSNNMVVGTISDKEIGIDIEKIKPINDRTLDLFASSKEKEYILEKDTKKRYYEIFCLKEAYVKMKGLCLKNIKSVEFYIKDNIITCSDKSITCELNKNIKEYVIAVCKYK